MLRAPRPADIYSTDEPAAAFHARIAFCMDLHNEVGAPLGMVFVCGQRGSERAVRVDRLHAAHAPCAPRPHLAPTPC